MIPEKWANSLKWKCKSMTPWCEHFLQSKCVDIGARSHRASSCEVGSCPVIEVTVYSEMFAEEPSAFSYLFKVSFSPLALPQVIWSGICVLPEPLITCRRKGFLCLFWNCHWFFLSPSIKPEKLVLRTHYVFLRIKVVKKLSFTKDWKELVCR